MAPIEVKLHSFSDGKSKRGNDTGDKVIVYPGETKAINGIVANWTVHCLPSDRGGLVRITHVDENLTNRKPTFFERINPKSWRSLINGHKVDYLTRHSFKLKSGDFKDWITAEHVLPKTFPKKVKV